MASVSIYYAPSNTRSRTIADAAHQGMRALGIPCRVRNSLCYSGVDSEIAIFYGLADGLYRVFNDYKREGKAVYVDLGYWGRRSKSKFDGYHKIVVNSRHPTEYFQKRNYSSDRFDRFELKIEPWREKGHNILLAGMSGKAAHAEGFKPEEWEKEIVWQLRRYTDRPIHYRPKPNWPAAKQLVGTAIQRSSDLSFAFVDCHAVVTHHSNVAVDAILAGIPAFCWEGVASVMSSQEPSAIDNPIMPEDRYQWASNIAWCQWTVDEMRNGLPWRHMFDEGII